MRRKPGLLAEIEAIGVGAWIRSLDGKTSKRQLDKALQRSLHPGKGEIVRMVDEELADLVSRQPRGKLGELAASEMRRREAWRGPARWSLIIAALAFIVSAAAFFRTL